MPASSKAPSPLRFDAFVLDLRAGELYKSGHKIRLQEQPFQILAMLLEQPSKVVTREQLRERVWPEDTFVDFDHSLNTAVKKLRQALNDEADNPRFIETLPKRGYRYVGPAAESVPAMESGPTAEVLRSDESASIAMEAAGKLNATSSRTAEASSSAGGRLKFAVFAAILVIVLGAGACFALHRRAPLTEKDTIVISDFSNSTGGGTMPPRNIRRLPISSV